MTREARPKTPVAFEGRARPRAALRSFDVAQRLRLTRDALPRGARDLLGAARGVSAGPLARILALVSCVPLLYGFSWFGAERDQARAGNRLYEAERYDEAVIAYGEGLSDHPDSEPLRFNLGAAQYKDGKFADAVVAFEKLAPAADPAAGGVAPGPPGEGLAAAAAYNSGNARFRLGRETEEQDPAGAVALYEEALVAYKRAMAADPGDDDPKFNHEFVATHLAALKKRLEEERQQQEQQQQEQQPEDGSETQAEEEQQEKGPDEEQQEGQREEQQDDPQENQQQAGQEPDREQPDEQAAQEPPGAANEQRQAGGQQPEPPAGGEQGATEGMTPPDARSLIDAARGEEVDPAEVQRQLAIPASIGEPEQEW